MFGAERKFTPLEHFTVPVPSGNVGCGGAGQVLAADVASLLLTDTLYQLELLFSTATVVPLERVVITAPPGTDAGKANLRFTLA